MVTFKKQNNILIKICIKQQEIANSYHKEIPYFVNVMRIMYTLIYTENQNFRHDNDLFFRISISCVQSPFRLAAAKISI